MAQGVEYYAVTTDAWTSRATQSYVTHTVHYILTKCGICAATFLKL